MPDLDNTRQQFMDFMYMGLDHGINSIKDSGGPLIPFLLIQTGDRKELKRFATERIEQGQIEAEKFLKSLKSSADMGLIAFDGFVTMEGQKYDAIIVRSFDKTAEEGLIFAQRYIPKQDTKGIDTIGNATLLGKEENIIKRSDHNESSNVRRRPWWKF